MIKLGYFLMVLSVFLPFGLSDKSLTFEQAIPLIILFLIGFYLSFFSKKAKIRKKEKKIKKLQNKVENSKREAEALINKAAEIERNLTGKEWTYKKKMAKAEKLKNEAKNIYEEVHDLEDRIRYLEIEINELKGNKYEKYTDDLYKSKNETVPKDESIKEENKNTNNSYKNADVIITKAQQKAQYIIAEAEKKAKEILGNAYENVKEKEKEQLEKKIEELRRIEKALRNTINGYGNEYIIPTYTVLDELIEEYGYSEASQKIKEIRKTMRKMIKDRTAAKCDYRDHYRANSAKDFVIDAFNGKVATIMAKIKHDNYGILRQKIIDAFHLVNKLGVPFQNAKITDEYLQLRLDELKYGTFLKELKLKDMEEQRRIREQMREEEKARREIEKALKEAQKEEEMLQKAMEKVKAEIAAATEQQKAKYEAQLEKLKQKLEEAEARNQRAISMAQQTKAGHVYIISNIGSFGENVYKIGMTRRLEPLDRVKELGDASVPFPFDVHALIYSENAPELENKLHKFFEEKRMNKVNLRKEFFKVTIAEIKEFLEKEGIEAKWTIQAEAAEYRETLAIEEGLKKGTYTKDRFGHFVPLKLEEYERN